MSSRTIDSKNVNKDTIIDWQLDKLQNNDDSPMPDEMAAFVTQDPELAAELDTLRQFWQPQQVMPVPSTKMKSDFYQALAQVQQSEANVKIQPDLSQSHDLQLKEQQREETVQNASAANDSYFRHAWVQAAAVVLVFVLGIFTGRKSFTDATTVHADPAFTALQEEVASLNTLMAISMLQNDSASQRLQAVSYTRRANLADPMLLDTLVNSLATEKSTAVKLAIIDTFKGKQGIQAIEQSLLGLAVDESQPMVQMALAQLILGSASTVTKTELIQQLQLQPLDPDVQEFLQLIDAQNRI